MTARKAEAIRRAALREAIQKVTDLHNQLQAAEARAERLLLQSEKFERQAALQGARIEEFEDRANRTESRNDALQTALVMMLAQLRTSQAKVRFQEHARDSVALAACAGKDAAAGPRYRVEYHGGNEAPLQVGETKERRR